MAFDFGNANEAQKSAISTTDGHVLDIDYYHLVFTCPGELNPTDLL